jgi:chromate transporter
VFELLDVFRVFARLALLGFGGALAILPEMARQTIDVHPWLTAREFADGYAIGQVAPGPNMLASLFYGYRAAGLLGGIAAGLGMFAPAAILSAVIAHGWGLMGDAPWPRAIRAALLPMGAGFMTGGAVVLARSAIHSAPTFVLAAAVVYLVYSGKLSPAGAVLLGGVAGAIGTLL